MLSFDLFVIWMSKMANRHRADFWPKSASPPIKDNTDITHLSLVIQAKNYRQDATNGLTVIITQNVEYTVNCAGLN